MTETPLAVVHANNKIRVSIRIKTEKGKLQITVKSLKSIKIARMYSRQKNGMRSCNAKPKARHATREKLIFRKLIVLDFNTRIAAMEV